MTDEEWTCPYCGFVNPYTLHVAFKDICIRCKKEKKTVVQFNEEIDTEIQQIDEDISIIRDKIRSKLEWIEGLEAEIRPEKERVTHLIKEIEGLVAEKGELLKNRRC